MKKTIAKIIVAVMALTSIFSIAGCKPQKGNSYNVVMSIATIPPVVASLESISNGYDTYAWIERGKTYSGIAQVEQFTNLGFDAGQNPSTGITEDVMNKVVNGIKQIKAKDKNCFVYLYCVDYNAYAGYAAVMQAGLKDDNFKIVLIEDGSGAYTDVATTYVTGQTTPQGAYTNYTDKVTACEAKLAEIKASNGVNTNGTLYSNTDNTVAIALAANENFQYIMQSKDRLEDVLDANPAIAGSDLYKALGIVEDNSTSIKKANMKFKSISEYVSGLTAEQKDTYLDLMFGSDKQTAINAFNRTTVGTVTVPTQKLVFVGGRVCQSGLNSVKDMTSVSEIVADYANLDVEYKEIFSTEADYTLIKNKVLASSLSDEAKVAAMNTYMEYVYSLKLTYRLYGDRYDILFKGHPSELVYGDWNASKYKVGETESYKDLEQDMVKAFYESDSEGKMIGMLPGGVTIENFAYVANNFALGGLSSSTYTGYEKDVVVEFMITSGNETLSTESNLATRYANGELTWTKGDTTYATVMMNKGNTYKYMLEYYTAKGNTELATIYGAKLNAWMIAFSDTDDCTIDTVANYTVAITGDVVAKAN